MNITRTSLMSGITRTLDIPVTMNQLQEYANGGLIQNVMGNLSEREREFISTGMTVEEWDEGYLVDE